MTIPGLICDMVAEQNGFIRVIDEEEEDYLFPKSLFSDQPEIVGGMFGF